MTKRVGWRPYRFSLATLLMLMTVAAFGCLWLRNYARRPRLEAELIEQLQTRHGTGISLSYQSAKPGTAERIGPVWWFTEQTPVLALEIREDVRDLGPRLFSTFSELRQAKILGQLSSLDRRRWERNGNAYSDVPWAGNQAVRAGSSLLEPKQWRDLLAHARLQELVIENQSLDASDLELIAGNRSLRHVTINNGRLDDADVAVLASMTWLETLTLRRNQFDGRTLAADLPRFAALHHLDLQQCPIHDGALAGIAALPMLRTLDLAHTSVRDDGIRSLARSRSLEELSLVDTFVSYRVGGDLAAMPSLKVVNLVRTGFDLKQLAAFRSRAAHLTVSGFTLRPSPLTGPGIATTQGTAMTSQVRPSSSTRSILPPPDEFDVELPPLPDRFEPSLSREF